MVAFIFTAEFKTKLLGRRQSRKCARLRNSRAYKTRRPYSASAHGERVRQRRQSQSRPSKQTTRRRRRRERRRRPSRQRRGRSRRNNRLKTRYKLSCGGRCGGTRARKKPQTNRRERLRAKAQGCAKRTTLALALFANRRYAASTRGATATRAGAGARRFLPPSKAAKIAATTEAAKCALRRST